MTTPNDDAERARQHLRGASGPSSGQVLATLVLAEAITTAARTIAHGMVEAARIRRGQA